MTIFGCRGHIAAKSASSARCDMRSTATRSRERTTGAGAEALGHMSAVGRSVEDGGCTARKWWRRYY